MNKTNEHTQADRPISIELLMDYVEGLLDPETAERISRLVSESDELSSIVEGIKFFYKEKGNDREALENYLTSIANNNPDWLTWAAESEKPVNNTRPKGRRLAFYQIAAVLALFLITGYVVFRMFGGEPSHEKLVADAISEIYSPPIMVRSDVQSDDQAWSDATEAYKSKDFITAAERFGQIVREQPGNLYATFYAGLSYLYASQPREARAYLETASNNDNRMKEQAMWYLALAYYKSGNREASRDVLQQIVDENEFKKEDAELLLKELNK